MTCMVYDLIIATVIASMEQETDPNSRVNAGMVTNIDEWMKEPMEIDFYIMPCLR